MCARTRKGKHIIYIPCHTKLRYKIKAFLLHNFRELRGYKFKVCYMYSASCTRPMALGRSMWFFGRKRSHRVVGRHWFWTFHPRRWCRTMKPTPKGALMHRGRAQTLAFRRTRRHRLSISVSMFRRCGNRNTKAAVGGHTWRLQEVWKLDDLKAEKTC